MTSSIFINTRNLQAIKCSSLTFETDKYLLANVLREIYLQLLLIFSYLINRLKKEHFNLEN